MTGPVEPDTVICPRCGATDGLSDDAIFDGEYQEGVWRCPDCDKELYFPDETIPQFRFSPETVREMLLEIITNEDGNVVCDDKKHHYEIEKLIKS